MHTSGQVHGSALDVSFLSENEGIRLGRLACPWCFEREAQAQLWGRSVPHTMLNPLLSETAQPEP